MKWLWLVGIVVGGAVLAFGLWTSYQGALGWQETYQACVEFGNTPLECKVTVRG